MHDVHSENQSNGMGDEDEAERRGDLQICGQNHFNAPRTDQGHLHPQKSCISPLVDRSIHMN